MGADVIGTELAIRVREDAAEVRWYWPIDGFRRVLGERHPAHLKRTAELGPHGWVGRCHRC